MENLTYLEWTALAAEISGSAAAACRALGITTGVVHRSSKDTEYVNKKYTYMLLGLKVSEIDPNTLLLARMINEYRSNPAVKAQIISLETLVMQLGD